jgi:hypothetical protein
LQQNLFSHTEIAQSAVSCVDAIFTTREPLADGKCIIFRLAWNKNLDPIGIAVKQTSVVLLTSESDYFIFNYVSDRVSRPYSAVGKVLHNPLDKKKKRQDVRNF